MSRADIHQFGWPNSELIMPISRVNRPQSGEWFDYTIPPSPSPSTPPPPGPVIPVPPPARGLPPMGPVVFWTPPKRVAASLRLSAFVNRLKILRNMLLPWFGGFVVFAIAGFEEGRF